MERETERRREREREGERGRKGERKAHGLIETQCPYNAISKRNRQKKKKSKIESFDNFISDHFYFF